MTDESTENVSLALYRYMCQNIVGSEERIKTIRMMNTVRDNLTRSNIGTIITSGSFGEGLEMRGSDIDIMFLLPYVEIVENMEIPFNLNKIYFVIETYETQPCFTKLRLIFSEEFKILKLCEKIGSEYYLSNVYIKELCLNKSVPIIHGPCVADEDGVFEIAYCLHSKSWITAAQQWITRSNNSWPGYKVKQSIIQHGVLFVPIGVKGSTKEELEWRISFSVGEKLLVNSFAHTQLLCYALMKILLKDVIDIHSECKEILCSYFIKTILFWISEELPISIWRPENLISNFNRCVRRLIYCVNHSVCPHYFISESNLFDNKIEGHAQEKVLKTLNTLYSYGWKCVLFSYQLSNCNEFMFHIRNENCPFYDDSPKILLSKFMFLTNCSILIASSSLRQTLSRMLAFESAKIKNLYLFYLSKANFVRAQSLPCDVLYENKSTYTQRKTLLNALLLNIWHDCGSGWLMIASFFYQSKQYNKALHILQYIVQKYSPEKLYLDMDGSHIHHKIFNLHCFRQMNIAKLSKYLLLDLVLFIKNSTLIPDELQIEVNKTGYYIPPVVYVHFLCFLCQYHLNNTIQCYHCLRDLQLSIEQEYFIANASEKARAYNILGISFQLIGDIASAQHAFIKSLELDSDPDFNNASLRLSRHV